MPITRRHELAVALATMALACVVTVHNLNRSTQQELLQLELVPRAPMLHEHWGGVGSEGYGTASWDNSGWNEHYHPRDGASMDSESMEPYFWRKGPRVNDEYTGHMADGDPVFNPPDDWEPPINFHKAAPSMLHEHWGGVGSEGYGTASWDNSGWNEHYHPRDGASMDSESMEPYFWRKGPRVNDEYTGHMADGDPVFNPPDDWEPPINFHKAAPSMLRAKPVAVQGDEVFVPARMQLASPVQLAQAQLLSHWGTAE